MATYVVCHGLFMMWCGRLYRRGGSNPSIGTLEGCNKQPRQSAEDKNVGPVNIILLVICPYSRESHGLGTVTIISLMLRIKMLSNILIILLATRLYARFMSWVTKVIIFHWYDSSTAPHTHTEPPYQQHLFHTLGVKWTCLCKGLGTVVGDCMVGEGPGTPPPRQVVSHQQEQRHSKHQSNTQGCQ